MCDLICDIITCCIWSCDTSKINGNRTARRQTNSRSVKSWTG